MDNSPQKKKNASIKRASAHNSSIDSLGQVAAKGPLYRYMTVIVFQEISTSTEKNPKLR